MKPLLLLLSLLCAMTSAGAQKHTHHNKTLADSIELQTKLYVDSVQLLAKQGNPLAECLLGYMLMQGENVEQNKKGAFLWMSRAAKHGVPNAYFYFGEMYRWGIGTEKNPEVAIYWLRKALHAGVEVANYSLGLMYEKGEGVTANVDSAIYYYKRVDDKLGIDYPDQIREMAERFVPEACYEMGMRDPTSADAFRWFGDGVKLGHAASTYRYAQFFDYGFVKKPNPKEAWNYYKLAAEMGDADAMFEVAQCYRMGRLIMKNTHFAQEWYRKAVAAGMKYAEQYIEEE